MLDSLWIFSYPQFLFIPLPAETITAIIFNNVNTVLYMFASFEWSGIRRGRLSD